MDKEAQEKVASKLYDDPLNQLRAAYTKGACTELANEIVQIIKELGYRKPLDRPELREKIIAQVNKFRWELDELRKKREPSVDDLVILQGNLADEILAFIPDRLPKGKPPLLTELEVARIANNVALIRGTIWDKERALLEAQRGADIKWYEEVKR